MDIVDNGLGYPNSATAYIVGRYNAGTSPAQIKGPVEWV